MTSVAIIGAGLAGAACAYALKKAGASPVVYEQSGEIASGASGNDLGMYNPRFTAERSAVSEYFTSAFSYALRTFKTLNDIEWDRCGALHLITDEKKERRYPQTLKNWQWDRDHMRLVTAEHASDISGVGLKYDALWLPDAGAVSPKKLCAAYLSDIPIKFKEKVDNLSELKEDVIIVAASLGSKGFSQTQGLPIKSVRGQVTQVNETQLSRNMKCNIHYGGYVSRPRNGVHMIGASFQPWLDHTKILLEDNAANIEKMGSFIPSLAMNYELVGNRASLRCASQDHFPIVGAVSGIEDLGSTGLYVSTAHGSHGIISSLIAAELITDMIMNRPRCLPRKVIDALSPARFL